MLLGCSDPPACAAGVPTGGCSLKLLVLLELRCMGHAYLVAPSVIVSQYDGDLTFPRLILHTLQG